MGFEVDNVFERCDNSCRAVAVALLSHSPVMMSSLLYLFIVQSWHCHVSALLLFVRTKYIFTISTINHQPIL